MVDRSDHAEALLQRIKDQESGRLTVFLGAAPGVGKTYAMLGAARERLQQGVDVVVGLVETHGRADTESMLADMAQLPRQSVSYHNTTLSEFDLDGALARHPQLILVDELAHTNVPGSRHKRRYQDIAELLSAGIDVFTTVNIQHLASLNDLVLQITGVRVRETVPDQFVDDAHEILFIDLPPAILIERLQQGKVYLPEYARSALDSFFSPSNLTALRELAMREVMERVDVRLTTELNADAKERSFTIQEKLLVLVSSNSDHEYLIRIGRQIADRRKIPWLVVWVDTGRVARRQASLRLQSAFSLARDLGAETETLRGPSTFQTVVPFIAEHRINTVLVGSGTRNRFRFWRKRLYQQLIESGLPLEVSVIRPPTESSTARSITLNTEKAVGISWKGHVFAALAVTVSTTVAVPLELLVANANLALVYVLAVVATGLKYGWRPAVTASILAFISFNFFLTEPRYTLHVTRQDELTTLIFLFIIALACGPAASRIRRQFILLRDANRYSEAMSLLGQELSVAEDPKAIWRAVHKVISDTLQVECIIVPTGNDAETWPKPARSFIPVDIAALDWTRRNGQMSGRFSDTLNASEWSIFPIHKDKHTVACVLIKFSESTRILPSGDKALITSITNQTADTWRRTQLVGELEAAQVKTEVEQIRSALLSSVSHDLKSPLAAMMGAAESLRLLDQQLDTQDRHELMDTILQESRRLDSYIQNLLDMTRLGYGTLKIERDWVSIADIVGSALTRLKRYYPNVKTETHFQEAAPVLYVHAALIEQALFNILENAARFTPDNEKIRVTITAQDGKCIIGIEDKGPGIPEDVREKIFDMFFVVSEGDKKKQNTGMGLAICRGMIGAHGGSIRAMEGTGHTGTKIEVKLPFDEPSVNNISSEE
ncbi:ATP-binding protein [Zobellella sp. DQSA1]|uniref:ATP-binding protein n=1 Tax=Zobellella sp. DQSA1 TaxID=3342386 RepID=UPI0035C19502